MFGACMVTDAYEAAATFPHTSKQKGLSNQEQEQHFHTVFAKKYVINAHI